MILPTRNGDNYDGDIVMGVELGFNRIYMIICLKTGIKTSII